MAADVEMMRPFFEEATSTQRVQVPALYTNRPQRHDMVSPSGARCVPYNYMDSFGKRLARQLQQRLQAIQSQLWNM